MGKQLTGAIAALLAIGVLTAGCGGGGDASTTTSISKAEFIKAANAACEKAEKQIQIDYRTFLQQHADVTKPTAAEYAELVSVVFVPNVEREIAQLRSLGAPSGDEQKVEAFLDARRESIQVVEEKPRMLLTEGEKVTAKSAQIAKEYGLDACGNP